MSIKNKQVFTNNTSYVKIIKQIKSSQANMTLLEDINLIPVSELNINTHVGPSERSATHV